MLSRQADRSERRPGANRDPHIARAAPKQARGTKDITMKPSDAYEQLRRRSQEIAYLGSAMAVLHWDQRTQIPRKGHAHRAGQLSALTGLRHQMSTDSRIDEELEIIEGSNWLSDSLSPEAVNVREWRRTYDRTIRIPRQLAMELARATTEAQTVWERARPGNDWRLFSPYLERIVVLKRDEAQALGYENEPYDALLEHYERGETAQRVGAIFQRLRPALVALLGRIQGRPGRQEPTVLQRSFPVAAQESFARHVAGSMGYDLEAGRVDVSAHPFTTGIGPGDVRITTRYDRHNFGDAFFSVIHESGHALYHQGLPLEHWGTPFCSPISLGINESQSRMWENMVARSEPFWKHFFPLAQNRFDSLADVTFPEFLHAVNWVAPGFIRVDADEVTYNLHVFLRFELERSLMRSDLAVKDLPDAWNHKMQQYLGLTPPDYASGVMQDIHWSSGAIGYFPTYALGNMYAAQFFHQASKDIAGLEGEMASGNLLPLREWTRKNIHSQGSRHLPRDLVTAVTREDLNPQYLIDYLETKYARL
jgi:carboxypeptidase Taq